MHYHHFSLENGPLTLGVISINKKNVFVNNKRTVIAREFFVFLENIGILMLFRMLSIRFKNLDTIVKKSKY